MSNKKDLNEINDQIQVRRQKMQELRDHGIDPFGSRFERTDRAIDLHQKYQDKSKDDLEKLNAKTAISGRIVAKRGKGKF